MVCTGCASCCARRVSSPCSDSQLNSNSSPSDHLGPMKKIRVSHSAHTSRSTHTSRAAREAITTCVSRTSVSYKECLVRECHVDRAGCSAYSIVMRTMCGVACSLRDKSCNFAEWLIATRAARSFYSVRTDPLRQHILCVSLTDEQCAQLDGSYQPTQVHSVRSSQSRKLWIS